MACFEQIQKPYPLIRGYRVSKLYKVCFNVYQEDFTFNDTDLYGRHYHKSMFPCNAQSNDIHLHAYFAK